ncbi:MLP-like protein 43 [Mangifera indica]|uniref:MLP-like protein 43 n=1 Tax=Mangifera indica TaxID=29780 RepID=UPI001CDA24DE|nr:MLP-like protein 43 [Mangifera indica]MCA2150961.1 MLP family protein [Citrobacter portucalensis]
MSLVGQLETDVEIKAPAKKFHDIFSCRPHHISNVCPEKIQGVDLHEGDWGNSGSVICWNYMHDGVPEVAKEIIEAIDDEINSTTFKVIEGHLLDKYKSFLFIVQASQKEEGSLVHWTLKYEKVSEEVPEPKGMLKLAIDVTKDIDAHLIKQAN